MVRRDVSSPCLAYLQMDDDIWDENVSVGSRGNSAKNRDKFKREITTHVSVHTLHLDGLRELYRHFLRLPDGAIVEVRWRGWTLGGR